MISVPGIPGQAEPDRRVAGDRRDQPLMLIVRPPPGRLHILATDLGQPLATADCFLTMAAPTCSCRM